MMIISSHVLDIAMGEPVNGMKLDLSFKLPSGKWEAIYTGKTNSDGRVVCTASGGIDFQEGTYRLEFEVGSYFKKRSVEAFYEKVTIDFIVKDLDRKYHVPLLLSPYGYSTYRGS